MHESAISYEGVDEDTVMDEEEPQKQEVKPSKAPKLPSKEALFQQEVEKKGGLIHKFTISPQVTQPKPSPKAAPQPQPSQTNFKTPGIPPREAILQALSQKVRNNNPKYFQKSPESNAAPRNPRPEMESPPQEPSVVMEFASNAFCQEVSVFQSI